jgi:hypothetical protein
MRNKSLSYILLAAHQMVFAADNETQLRLNNEIFQQQRQQEQSLKAQQEQDNSTLPHMVINGETIAVPETIEDVGRALYLSVMNKQWQAVKMYLDAYQRLDHHDPSLVFFSQGALARIQAQPELAEDKFQQALALQPQNAILKLELARVWTELQKNRDAEQLFQQVKNQLAISSDQAAINMINNIESYLRGLKQRDAWQGSVAFGSRYATNINSSAQQSTTVTFYLTDSNGTRIPYYSYTRQSPSAVDTEAFDYEATLMKRWSLSGNHGLRFKALAYGQSYQDYREYNEMAVNVHAGYSYQDNQNQYLLAPVFENKRYGNQNYYNAWGGHAEWMHFFSRNTAFKLETEIKDIRYNDDVGYDGTENNVFVTFWKILPQSWILFTGLDYVDHNTQEQYIGAYQQQGFRLGFTKEFKFGLNASVYSAFRWRQYDLDYAVFETRRHDYEQNYTAVLQIPKLKFFGLTPNVMYRYIHNKSNVDWLYSYDKQYLSLKLEHRF